MSEAQDPFANLRGPYRVIAADPPWRFKSNSVANSGRNALRHYACMTLDDIIALPVADIVARFMWIPGPFFAIGAHLPIMRAWGFKPSGMGFVWIKLNPNASPEIFRQSDLAMGGGFTTRKNAEFCVLGKRGRSVRRDAGVHEVIAKRREHSRKPDEFYHRVERYTGGPRVDLFSRETRAGWDSFGLETSKFDQEKAPAGLRGLTRP
jgi:N6-adenosine-specific RNA methylase IME4